MKGDFTRQTFRSRNHYRSVLVQQGRVQLDADANEQAQIQAYLDEVTGTDTIGVQGAPEHNAGMAIVDTAGNRPHGTPWAHLQISEGRYYVDGILCENDQAVPLGAQPDLPGVDVPSTDGTYIAYLDVWQEHLTALEQQHLLEVALGGVTTTTRARTIWQVRFRSADTAQPSKSDGRLSARAEAPADDSTTPCAVASSVGYRRLENQLYRVEIHDPSGVDENADPVVPTFVWSRENGSVAARLLNVSGDVLTVDTVGLDDRLSFAANPLPWVEVIDLATQRRGEHGYLGHIARIDDTKLTIDKWRGESGPPDGDPGPGAVVRRWESQDAQPVTFGNWIPLEDGVEVQFAEGTLAIGDYWLIPARTANLEGAPAIQGLTGNVDWPVDDHNDPVLLPPDGVQHSYADIAVLVRSGDSWTLSSDDRKLFPPLTELAAQVDVQYAGGDGQRVVPGDALPRPLEVSVSRAGFPVPKAKVRFTGGDGDAGDGRLALDPGGLDGPPTPWLDVLTGANGVAQCWWRPANDPSRPSQRITAGWVPPDAAAPTDPPIDFSAALDIAPPSARITAGQGQLARPGAALPDPLGVEVRDAHGAVLPDATVVFTVTSGAVAADEAGLAAGNTAASVVTDGSGHAACWWQLGEESPLQTLAAAALTPGSAPATPPAAVTFVAGVPAGSPFATGLHVTGAVLARPGAPLTNDLQVQASDLGAGIAVLLDGAPDPTTVDGKPVLTVVLDLPFPASNAEKDFWGQQVSGTMPLTLAGKVTATEVAGTAAVTWTPTDDGATLLSNLIASVRRTGTDQVLAHLNLSGRSVVAADKHGVVNGLAVTAGAGGPDPRFPSVDDGRGADFQLRFWLVESVGNLMLVPAKGSRLALKSTTDAIASAVPRDALRATLRAGISVAPGPGQDAALARRAVGRAFRNGAPRQVTLVVDDRYTASAMVIKDAMAAVGVTMDVVSAADPAAEVTTRRAAGDPVDGVLTDHAGLDPVTALPDVVEAVPV